MAKLNRDILKEVFYEVVKKDFNDVDKFMMAGREPFQLVLDVCKKAKTPIFFRDYISAQLPSIKYSPSEREGDNESSDDEDHEHEVQGTQIPTKMALFKPISLAIASSMTSLDIRGFSPALIPMLKSLDREMREVIIQDTDKHLKNILEACTNIPNVEDGVTIKLCPDYSFASGMSSFAIPCQKLTIKRAFFNTMYETNILKADLRNLRDLVIKGKFKKTCTIYKELKQFVAFISKTFPNLETLNVEFLVRGKKPYFWNWNDKTMASFFRALPYQIRGSFCFKIINDELDEVNREKFPDVQKGDKEYYRNFSVRDNFTFKLAYWYDEKYEARNYWDNDDYGYWDNNYYGNWDHDDFFPHWGNDGYQTSDSDGYGYQDWEYEGNGSD